MPYIWRVENDKGEGAYYCRADWKISVHEGYMGRPGPQQELAGNMLVSWTEWHPPWPKGWRSGCASKAELHAWFTQGELRALAAAGYTVRRKRAARILWRGRMQLTYMPRRKRYDT